MRRHGAVCEARQGGCTMKVVRGQHSCGVMAELCASTGLDHTVVWVLTWASMADFTSGYTLCMLGHGNMAALDNNPRVNPRARQAAATCQWWCVGWCCRCWWWRCGTPPPRDQLLGDYGAALWLPQGLFQALGAPP